MAGFLTRDTSFTDREWAQPFGSGIIELVNPAPEEAFGAVSPKDIDAAVRARPAAQPGWAWVCPACGPGTYPAVAERAGDLAAYLPRHGMPLARSGATVVLKPSEVARSTRPYWPTSSRRSAGGRTWSLSYPATAMSRRGRRATLAPVFSDVIPQMPISQEEIFGPMLAIMPHGENEDVVQIANDNQYDLPAPVQSADRSRALKVTESSTVTRRG
jgi:hypothetical protein